MKKISFTMIFIATAIPLLLAACAMPDFRVYRYDLSLSSPSSSEKIYQTQQGEAYYADEDLEINFGAVLNRINISLHNKTASPIIINWDYISYISVTGISSRIIHSGVRFTEREHPQAPTLVPPQSVIQDSLIPSDNIYYEYSQYGGWRNQDLFPGEDKSIYIGQEFGIFWPMEINGMRRDYNFKIRIDSATLLKQAGKE